MQMGDGRGKKGQEGERKEREKIKTGDGRWREGQEGGRRDVEKIEMGTEEGG